MSGPLRAVALASLLAVTLCFVALARENYRQGQRITELERRNARDDDGSAKRVQDAIDRIREIGNRPSKVDATDVFGTEEHGKRVQSKIDQAKGK